MTEESWETMIAARLRLLAAADQDRQAPPRVEAALRAAYRRCYAPRRAVWPWVAAWGAVAASVLAFLALTASPRRNAPPEKEQAPPAPTQLEAAPVPLLPTPRPRSRPKRYNARALPAPAESEVASDFVPLVESDLSPADEIEQVVRVRLPRAVLTSFGLPVDDDPDDAVQADVVLGADGVAHAIRFITVSQLGETTR